MTLTSNYNILPNIRINIEKGEDGEYLVATSPDCQGLVTEGKTENELIKNVIEVMELFKEENYLENKEYNIILNYIN